MKAYPRKVSDEQLVIARFGGRNENGDGFAPSGGNGTRGRMYFYILFHVSDRPIAMATRHLIEDCNGTQVEHEEAQFLRDFVRLNPKVQFVARRLHKSVRVIQSLA